ncbi:putative transcription factor TGA like domain-containing protein [Medicago truncatula]|uniref:Putative transcription factor TGA like domain-containing protein n=2 Tax=Medicago truncatula TaxID=3880 RepID=Q2HSA7_MEDTR|nr:tumor-related protein-like, putative [Medicago truncatula]AES66592.1 transcription factor TGA5-like protein [Medicago truncatula]RHN74929.1 putative transcription factor TGA like domain-containing protein [Medicago truncatula]
MTNFAQFYESWHTQFNNLIHQLKLSTSTQTDSEELIQKVLSHHQDYYNAKSMAAEKDPLHVLASPWATTLERSLHWIAGWRPTTAFHLIYTESSLLFESHIIDILRGFRTGDLGDLSPNQFRRVSDLQCDTVKEENAITEELSEWQDSASDMMGSEADINDKIERLVSIIKKADDLRLRTLRSVVEFLSPQQAVEFLIASAELVVGIRGWGLNHDRSRPRIR